MLFLLLGITVAAHGGLPAQSHFTGRVTNVIPQVSIHLWQDISSPRDKGPGRVHCVEIYESTS